MLFPIFCINTALAFLALVNFISIRRPGQLVQVEKSVVVLLPVRNEESNIARIIGELQRQTGISRLSITVINDNSEDRTRELALSVADSKTTIIDAPPPPPGWIGKVSALQFGLTTAPHADIYISVDADVHFQSDAIARAITLMEKAGIDFISPYPRQIAQSWAERLIQPLLQWSWMSTVLLRGAEKFPLASTVICNGQFLVMRGDALRSIGGFEPVASKVLDDIELGRAFVRGGFCGAVVDGSALAATRMYSTFNEIKAGYGKSLHTAFGSIIGSVFAALFIVATGILPFLAALSGDGLAISALVLIILSRALSASSSAGRVRDSLLHPLSAALFLYLLYFSWRNRGKTQWKGRTL
jgi:cellulose synthase/poly-beta-1,6-N-acetylglucosamine synthase-like glycosyltransferase